MPNEQETGFPGEIPPELMSIYEREGTVEMLSANHPDRVRLGARLEASTMEVEAIYDETHPNDYGIQMTVRQMRGKADSLELDVGLGLTELTKAQKKDGLEDPIKRERLINMLRDEAGLIRARTEVLTKLMEQEAYADDITEYCVTAFTRARKRRVYSRHYGEIFRAPETFRNLERYGTKVALAYEAWREAAKGRAKVKITSDDGIRLFKRKETADGRLIGEEQEASEIEGTLPNPFAMPLNFRLLNLAIEKWVAPQVGFKTEKDGSVLRKLEERDNRSAAITALVLFKHWDAAIVNSLGIKGTGKALDPTDISARDLELISHEISRSTGDAAKLIIEPRRIMEYAGDYKTFKEGESREHPYSAGAPASIGCYPTLIASFPELTVVEGIEVWRGDGDGVVKKKMPMTIETLCFGDGTVEVLERKDEKGKDIAEPRLVKYKYEKLKLNEIPWDDIASIGFVEEEVVDADGRPAMRDGQPVKRVALSEGGVKLLMVHLGVNADAFEIPHKLAQYYTTAYMFNQFLRMDYEALWEDVMGVGRTPDLLPKMNKAIQVGLGIMGNYSDLGEDRELMGKLGNYVRVVFLGSLAVARTRISKSRGGQTAERRKRSQVLEPVRPEDAQALKYRAAVTGFFSTRITQEGLGVVPKQEALFNRILKEGIAPTPDQTDWFSKAELKKLAPYYPFLSFT